MVSVCISIPKTLNDRIKEFNTKNEVFNLNISKIAQKAITEELDRLDK